MKSNPRGLMVIINMQKFVVDPKVQDKVKLDTELTERKGSEKDVDELNDLFSRYLNFKVCIVIDRPRRELLRRLREIAENPAYKDYDCLAVCIMSHGKDDVFYAYDGNTIKFSAVYSMFYNSHCEVFRNKPKLFFVQACRRRIGVADGPSVESASKVPQKKEGEDDKADMLIAYSCFEDCTSYRHMKEGSYFIQTLVSVFKENADNEHIMDMMTRVVDGVYKHSQVPANVLSLRHKLYFWPGMDFDEGS